MVGGPLQVPSSTIGADFREGDEHGDFSVFRVGYALTSPDLFTELPLLRTSLPNPSFTECLPRLTEKELFFIEKRFVAFPSKTSFYHILRYWQNSPNTGETYVFGVDFSANFGLFFACLSGIQIGLSNALPLIN